MTDPRRVNPYHDPSNPLSKPIDDKPVDRLTDAEPAVVPPLDYGFSEEKYLPLDEHPSSAHQESETHK